MKNKKIVSNVLWLVYNKVFNLFLNLFVTVKIVNHFGSAEYGSYEYAVSVVAVLEVIVSLVDGRVTKKYYLDKDPASIVYNSTLAKVILSLVALCIGLAYSFIYKGDNEFNLMFFVLLFNSIISNLRFGMENHFEYNLQSRSIVIRSNVALLIASVLQLIAVHYDAPIITLCFISTIAAIISFVTIYIQYRIQYKVRLINKIDISFIKVLIIESIPLAIAAAAATIYTKCDSIMLGNILGKPSVGVYAVGLKLFSIAQIAIVPVRTSLFPKQLELSRTDKEKYKHLYIYVSSMMTWLCILGILISYVILPPLFSHFLSAEYADGLKIFNINVFAVLFLYNSALRSGHMTITNHTNVLMYTQVACAVLNILLNAVLIRKIGISGAAIATVITQAISVMFSNLFFSYTRELFFWQLAAFNPINLYRALRYFVGKRTL